MVSNSSASMKMYIYIYTYFFYFFFNKKHEKILFDKKHKRENLKHAQGCKFPVKESTIFLREKLHCLEQKTESRSPRPQADTP